MNLEEQKISSSEVKLNEIEDKTILINKQMNDIDEWNKEINENELRESTP